MARRKQTYDFSYEKKGRKVFGSEDPYSQESMELFEMLVNELKDLEPGETYEIPIEKYNSSVKMRGMLHAVASRLKWEKVMFQGQIRAYLTTIKANKLYVKRLG